MADKKIIIKYEGDFEGDKKIASEIYSRLKENYVNPLFIDSSYSVSTQSGKVEYTFKSEEILPQKSELEKMLEGINFDSTEIIE